MSQLGLKEQFRCGSISASEALELLGKMGALDSKTAKWFKRKNSSGDSRRSVENAGDLKAKNLEANEPKEHNRKWRRSKGRFEVK